MNGYAHWVGEGGDGNVVVDTGGVQRVEKINEPVVYEFFQIKEELTNCGWYFSRVVPPENVNDRALINGMVRIDDLRPRESVKGIDGNEDYADRIIVNGTPPLKIVICCEGERRTDESFPKRREGSVVGLMD